MTLAWFRRAALPLALGCLLSSCAAQSPTGGTAAAAIEPDTFKELDGSLRTTFARARSGVAGAIGPMVTVDGRSLTWWRASDPAWSRGSDASWRHTFDAKLFEHLRKFRRQLAETKHVPPFIVFGDVTLQELAREQPSTMEEFRQIHGVGERKAAEYGIAFLQAIAEFASPAGASTV